MVYTCGCWYIHTQGKKEGGKQPQSLVERQSPLERYELKEITWRDDDDRDYWSLFSEESKRKCNTLNNIMFEV